MLTGMFLPVILLNAERNAFTGRVFAIDHSLPNMEVPEIKKPDEKYVAGWLDTLHRAETIYPREPKPNELSMEKAIQRSIDFINSWVSQGLLPKTPKPLSTYAISARFLSVQSKGKTSDISYWEIDFSDESFDSAAENAYAAPSRISLMMDAATGAVFSLQHNLYAESYTAPYRKIAEQFMDQFDFLGDIVQNFDNYEFGHYSEFQTESGIRLFIGSYEKMNGAGLIINFQ